MRSPNRAVGLSPNPRWGARTAIEHLILPDASRDASLTFHPFIPALSSLLSRALAFTPTGRGSVDWLSQSTRSTTQGGSCSRGARRSDTIFGILKQARSGFFLSPSRGAGAHPRAPSIGGAWGATSQLRAFLLVVVVLRELLSRGKRPTDRSPPRMTSGEYDSMCACNRVRHTPMDRQGWRAL